MAGKNDVWTRNFARTEAIREKVREVILPKLKSIRDNRSDIEAQWMRFYNMWNVVHDDAHLYQGRAKLYIPEVRKNIEAQARQFVDSAFPSDDYIDCYPGMAGTRKGANLQKAIRMWQIEQAQLPLKYHVFSRQKCLYGTSVAYVAWSKRVEHAFKNARDPKTGKIKATRQLVELYNGPDFMVRDMFKWYTLNAKREDLGDEGCVEYRVLNRFDLVELDRANLLYGLDRILQGNSDAYSREELYRDIERAENLGYHINPTQGYAGVASLAKDENASGTNNFLCATVYAKIAVPEACLEGEDPKLGIPFKIEIYNNEHIGFAGRNPFFHQRAPYVIGKYIQPNPDEFYGQGIPQATQYQQYELNSKAEQSMDSVTYALNPIAFLDPAMAAQGANFEIEPGAKWFINPQGVKFGSMPDVSQTGNIAIANLRSQIQDFSDRTPAMPPQLAGKARTATQAEIVNNVISIDIKSFQRLDELMVLQPLMEMWESLTEQNAEDDQMVMLLGKNSTDWQRIVVGKEALLGNYRYFWKVSTSLQNKQMQAHQIIDAMKVAGSLPPDIQQKLNFNWAEAYRTFWQDLMNLPNADLIVNQPDGVVAQDPETIIKMLKLGMEVEVLPGDDDVQIIRALDEELKQTKDKSLKEELVRQILLHQKQLEAKVQQMQQQRQMQMMQMQMAMQAQAQGGKGAQPQQGGMQGSGNRSQLSPGIAPGAMASGVRA